MEAIAKHDFNATAEDELSFRKSQVLKVREGLSELYESCQWNISSLKFHETWEEVWYNYVPKHYVSKYICKKTG